MTERGKLDDALLGRIADALDLTRQSGRRLAQGSGAVTWRLLDAALNDAAATLRPARPTPPSPLPAPPGRPATLAPAPRPPTAEPAAIPHLVESTPTVPALPEVAVPAPAATQAATVEAPAMGRLLMVDPLPASSPASPPTE